MIVAVCLFASTLFLSVLGDRQAAVVGGGGRAARDE